MILNKLDRKFFNDSMKEPMLSRAEEKELAEAWVFKNDKKAMHKIIKAYSKLVIAFSMKFKNYGIRKKIISLRIRCKRVMKYVNSG